ncbi:hypothetical protein AV530_007648 [Patagioenas fasciata monilis]|uniref:Uncharacterized protein n=1 Tax=Patagioenas fasciata monilis TaxID=372326 RepID=A0A1V4JYW6_PATFA|nr:hypothetical protein AV530_007648 [Patagioenas fasciata monilis]
MLSVFCDTQHIWRWTWSIWQGRKDLEAGAVSAVQENQECDSAKAMAEGPQLTGASGSLLWCCQKTLVLFSIDLLKRCQICACCRHFRKVGKNLLTRDYNS